MTWQRDFMFSQILKTASFIPKPPVLTWRYFFKFSYLNENLSFELKTRVLAKQRLWCFTTFENHQFWNKTSSFDVLDLKLVSQLKSKIRVLRNKTRVFIADPEIQIWRIWKTFLFDLNTSHYHSLIYPAIFNHFVSEFQMI